MSLIAIFLLLAVVRGGCAVTGVLGRDWFWALTLGDADVPVGDGAAGANPLALPVGLPGASIDDEAVENRGRAGVADPHAATVGQTHPGPFGCLEDAHREVEGQGVLPMRKIDVDAGGRACEIPGGKAFDPRAGKVLLHVIQQWTGAAGEALAFRDVGHEVCQLA